MIERIKFKEFVLFSLILVGIIDPITGCWKWNASGWLNQLGFINFAGSTLVPTVGACAGVVGAIILGPRIGRTIDSKPQAIPGSPGWPGPPPWAA